MNELTTLLENYNKEGFVVKIEIPNREYLKIFATVTGCVIACALAYFVLKSLIANS